MARPFVSVAIPTYRRANDLPGALQSALTQTWRDIDVIVDEDGSHDGKAEGRTHSPSGIRAHVRRKCPLDYSLRYYDAVGHGLDPAALRRRMRAARDLFIAAYRPRPRVVKVQANSLVFLPRRRNVHAVRIVKHAAGRLACLRS